MAIFPKLTYRFNTKVIKISADLTEFCKLILKFTRKIKLAGTAKTSEKEQS